MGIVKYVDTWILFLGVSPIYAQRPHIYAVCSAPHVTLSHFGTRTDLSPSYRLERINEGLHTSTRNDFFTSYLHILIFYCITLNTVSSKFSSLNLRNYSCWVRIIGITRRCSQFLHIFQWTSKGLYLIPLSELQKYFNYKY